MECNHSAQHNDRSDRARKNHTLTFMSRLFVEKKNSHTGYGPIRGVEILLLLQRVHVFTRIFPERKIQFKSPRTCTSAIQLSRRSSSFCRSLPRAPKKLLQLLSQFSTPDNPPSEGPRGGGNERTHGYFRTCRSHHHRVQRVALKWVRREFSKFICEYFVCFCVLKTIALCHGG